MRMDERKNRVLQAIVQDYIATAAPVGSRTIARKYCLGVSPATIRNEMADLEELGLIEQPHTSAGRVPSDKGYRYYVDCIMEAQRLTDAEKKYIRERYEQKIEEIEEVIARTSQLLSTMTNYTALVLGPHWEHSLFQHIKLLPLDEERALLIVVTSTRIVEHRIIDLPPSITPTDLERISEVLNSRLRGVALEKIKKATLNDIYGDLLRQKYMLKMVLEVVEQVLKPNKEDKVYLGGTLNILNQPEFKDVQKLKKLLGVLEEESMVRDLLLEDDDDQRLVIKIGGENKCQDVQECSIITATYHVNGQVLGKIGLLGPTRMEYAKAVTMVEFVANSLSEAITRLLK